MQDLARYVAGRWPVQAQSSKQSKAATAEGRQPTKAAHSLASIRTTLAGLVRDVLAAEISVSQPLMEVRDLQPHASLPNQGKSAIGLGLGPARPLQSPR